MRWAQVIGQGTNAQIAAYGNDEKGLLLGVNGATPMAGASQNGSNGQTGGASYHVSGATGGSLTATDPSGRPYFPALYITDLTTNPLNSNGTAAGDFQAGGKPVNVSGGVPFISDVFGTWSTANVGTNGANYSVTPPLDKNDWNLGTGSDAPVGTTFSAMGDEGYGAEVRWNVNQLMDSNGQPLKAGDNYRIQIIEHDGDQNKTGGDAGEFCVNLTIPQAKPALATSASSGTVGGNIQDSAILSGGTNPTGTITWNLYGPGDTSCSNSIETLTDTNIKGDGTYMSPTYKTTAAGTYRWVASYSGDAGNAKASGACNDPNESSTVTPATPTLVTSATSGPVGSSIQDTATLSGSFNATGTITWSLYGPGDTTCSSKPIQTFTDSNIKGDGNYTSPSYTATTAGSYRWIASYSGDGNNLSTSGACNDPGETSTVAPGTPTLTTNAVSGTVGQPIHDVAHLTGGSNPTGTITWNVFDTSKDSSCSTPLNTTPITATVNGDGDYTSPDYTPSSAGSYEWVATYSGDNNNVKLSTACADPNEVSTVQNAAAPAITLHKLERIGSSGSFTHGPVTGDVNDTVNYEMMVTNTGNTTLVIAFTDDQCDGGTLSGPSVVSGNYNTATNTLASGGELMYTCSHVLAAGDQPYTNTASVIGTPPSGSPVSASDSVKAFANVPGIKVVKLQRDGSSGAFTTNQITASVGDTINYEVQVTNTGNVPLTLTLDDAHCDAGTIQGPVALSGTLTGTDTLSAGGVAQYTCSHVVTANDIPQYTNTAVVTGQPPTGPPVHGTGIVVANITQAAIQVLKLEKDATANTGGFTSGPITVVEHKGDYVVHTIDYEIQVTNTGDVPLTLSLEDPRCDAGTVQGPAVITGTLNGDVLSPGGQAQYTCSHRYVEGDSTPFTNTATVTGTPPNGPAVHGTSSVTVDRKTVASKKLCRDPRTGRIIHYTGRKPAACKASHKPHKPSGFTG